MALTFAGCGKLQPTNRTDMFFGHVDPLLVLFQSFLVREPSKAYLTLNRTVLGRQLGLHSVGFVSVVGMAEKFFFGIENLGTTLSAADISAFIQHFNRNRRHYDG